MQSLVLHPQVAGRVFAQAEFGIDVRSRLGTPLLDI